MTLLEENALQVLRKIEKPGQPNLIYEAVVKVYCEYFNKYASNVEGDNSKLIVEFIKKLQKVGHPSPQVRYLYSRCSLLPKIKKSNYYAQECFKNFKEIITFPRFKTFQNYEILTTLGLGIKKFENVRSHLKEWQEKITLVKENNNNLAKIYIYLGMSFVLEENESEARKYFKQLYALPTRDVGELSRVLLRCLKILEMEEEASEIIRRKTDTSLQRVKAQREKIILLIQQQKELKKAALEEKEKENRAAEQVRLDQAKRSLSSMENLQSKEVKYAPVTNTSPQEEISVPSKKKKIKKKGVANLQKLEKSRPVKKKAPQETPSLQELPTLEKLLGKNSDNYQTVEEMFDVLIGTKKAASVKISMDKVELLGQALGG